MWHANIPCANCGMACVWTKNDLEKARERLLRGDHAAPACSDACANKSEPWKISDLESMLTRHNAADEK